MKQYNENSVPIAAESHFGEQSQDKIWSFRDQLEYSCPTEWGPKYEFARSAAFAALSKYGLSEEDFWIKKELSVFKDKIIYVNLILSHAGCIKVNEKLPEARQFKPSCVREAKGGQDGGVALIYSSDEQHLFKTGEASPRNSSRPYLYAAAERRLFDRVVTALSGLYENGIYGEAESDSFSKESTASAEAAQMVTPAMHVQKIPGDIAPLDSELPAVMDTAIQPQLSSEERTRRIEFIKRGIPFTRTDCKKMLDFYGVFDFSELEDAALIDATSKMETKISKEKALRAAQQSITANAPVPPASVRATPVTTDPAMYNNQGLSPIAQMIASGCNERQPEDASPAAEPEAFKKTPIGETIYTVSDSAPKSFQDMSGQTLDQIGKEMLRGLYKRANAAGRKYVSPELLKTIEQYIA